MQAYRCVPIPKSEDLGACSFRYLGIQTSGAYRDSEFGEGLRPIRQPRTAMVSYCYLFRRKEGTMKKFNMPGDPKTLAVFLPGISRS
jgi:hypothetical protein